jgi:hypothetical protein
MATVVLYLCMCNTTFAFLGSPPKIHQKHISKDIVGQVVQSWTFQDGAPCRVNILDAKYDEDTAIVYVSVKATDIQGKSGREGKLRLEYEYAADDWNLLEIKAISFSALRAESRKKFREEALHFVHAARDGNVTLVKDLLAQGANVNLRDEDGATALILSGMRCRTDVVQLLLHKGANLNATNFHGWTPLKAASYSNCAAVVRLLLNAGADVNFKGHDDSQTALMFAALHGQASAVRALIEGGADVNFKDDDGCTAVMYAERHGHNQIAQWLKNGGKLVPRAKKYDERRSRILKDPKKYTEAKIGKLVGKQSHEKLIFVTKLGRVFFDHRIHHEKMKYECMECHHNYDPDYSLTYKEFWSCANCHPTRLDRNDPDVPSLANALHNLCNNCHQNEGRGPLNCLDCHY